MTDLLYSYKTTVKFLGSVLGPDYEVVLQDLSNINHSVIAIENGHISGRTIGSPLTSAVFQMLSSKVYEEDDFIANYKGVAENGHILRSSSMFIKDSTGNPIGLLCINFDDSRYIKMDLPRKGAVISSGMAEKYKLKDGDEFLLKEQYEDKLIKLQVRGILDSPTTIGVYLSHSYYEDIFDVDKEY